MILVRSLDLPAAGENFRGFCSPKYSFLLKICSKQLKFLPWWDNLWIKFHRNFTIYIYTGLYIYREISILVREFHNLYIYRVIYIPGNPCTDSERLNRIQYRIRRIQTHKPARGLFHGFREFVSLMIAMHSATTKL